MISDFQRSAIFRIIVFLFNASVDSMNPWIRIKKPQEHMERVCQRISLAQPIC